MISRILLLLLLLGSGTAPLLAQRYKPGKNQHSLITVELGKGNALLVSFDRLTDVVAHRNIDSVLQLFVSDYRKIVDTAANPLTARYVILKPEEHHRSIQVTNIPQTEESYHFSGEHTEPALLKTKSDTLQIAAWLEPATKGWQPGEAALYFYVIYNDLSQLQPNLNAKLEQAIQSIRTYKNHDLNHPKYAFRMIQRESKAEFPYVTSVRPAFVNLHPQIEVGLIRHQLVPAVAFGVGWVPNTRNNVEYWVSYQKNFFFPSSVESAIQTNDFLSVGVSFFKRTSDSRDANFRAFSHSLSLGYLIRKRGDYFPSNTFRITGTVFNKGIIGVSPELYMNGFFKKVYPGVRIRFGL